MSSTGYGQRLFVGQLGVGIAVPLHTAHLYGATGVTVNIQNTGDSSPIMYMSSGRAGAEDVVLASFAFKSTAVGNNTVAKIDAVQGPDTTSRDDAHLVFSTAESSGSGPVERMRLTASGNMIVSSLKGTGTRMVVTDNMGVLSAPLPGMTSYTPTLTGWASTTTVACSYCEVGPIVFVQFKIEGTGNTSLTSVSLPLDSSTKEGIHANVVCTDNSGSWAVGEGLSHVPDSANAAEICWPAPGGGDPYMFVTSWGNGMTKITCGCFWYHRKRP